MAEDVGPTLGLDRQTSLAAMEAVLAALAGLFEAGVGESARRIGCDIGAEPRFAGRANCPQAKPDQSRAEQLSDLGNDVLILAGALAVLERRLSCEAPPRAGS